MFELIPSKYMRNYFKSSNFKFTDFQKATLIWNMSMKTLNEKMAALKELSVISEDKNTKNRLKKKLHLKIKRKNC